ncbi:MAG: di-heme oxidoredictase family protein [Bryobacteraceae bacterium]
MQIDGGIAFRKLARLCAIALATCLIVFGQSGPTDPGVRDGAPGAGQPLNGLVTDEATFFQDGLSRFVEVESVTGGKNNGLGPRFNSNSCVSCHAQPAIGGSSPAVNPEIAVATLNGATNSLPWFVTASGPPREVRFQKKPDGSPDGGVHNLFVITGRKDAAGCNIAQPDFGRKGDPITGKGGNPNVIFRIPTPVFGAGLIEAIPDSAILANLNAEQTSKQAMGIRGRPNAYIPGNANRSTGAKVSAPGPNTSGNDGTITRFGWKAQNKSLLLFAAEAYNVEMGVTNQLFPQERDETPGCLFNATPEDTDNFTVTSTGATNPAVLSDIEGFAVFMRMLAPPVPAPDTPSIVNGRAQFSKIGCALCHTPTLTTGQMIASGSVTSPSAVLSNQKVNLYSDLLLHHMGEGLADGISQGAAGPDEFRSAPLWGIGQRIFFLHDGRTSNLVEAIRAHHSKKGHGYPASEANQVIVKFNKLTVEDQQDIINFLRAL